MECRGSEGGRDQFVFVWFLDGSLQNLVGREGESAVETRLKIKDTRR